MPRKKQPSREDILAQQLDRLIVAVHRAYNGEIGFGGLKMVADESHKVLYPQDDGDE